MATISGNINVFSFVGVYCGGRLASLGQQDRG